jgi:hypothetical protein
MGVHLFLFIFDEERKVGFFRNGQFNLYGRPARGKESEPKIALDQHIVSILKEFIENHAPHGTDKAAVWSS